MNENGVIARYPLWELLTRPGYFQVPLYQRSYAWDERQIDQLLEDLYSAFKNNKDGDYYLGTLVVMQRDVGVLEVVDGQQRLTTLELLFRHLGLISECNLRFENRPDATSFLQAFFGKEQSCLQTPAAMAAACQCFKNYVFVRAGEEGGKKPYAKPLQEEDAFATFLKERVCLYQITLPSRSDVARYFEVMNNRGVQLADVDVVKSRLMKHVQDREAFRIRWERCADFTCPRKLVAENPQEAIPREHSEARMDFPNFLLIALSLCKECHKDVSLDERLLLSMFDAELCEKAGFAESFLSHLEAVRDRFDDWFIRADLDDQGNIQQWVIRPWEETTESTGDRKKLIALESMLEVTYTSRRYRNWVKDALRYLLDKPRVTEASLLQCLTDFIRERLKECAKDPEWLNRGTDTPHLVLNLLDYLLMKPDKTGYLFRHRSSIEHFMPRDGSYCDSSWAGPELDSIGNLCLMSGSDNSALRNHAPKEKMDWWHNNRKDTDLTPKQRAMYNLAVANAKGWDKETCACHNQACRQLLLDFLAGSTAN